jgi:hypothetical protein
MGSPEGKLLAAVSTLASCKKLYWIQDRCGGFDRIHDFVASGADHRSRRARYVEDNHEIGRGRQGSMASVPSSSVVWICLCHFPSSM